VRVDHDKLTRGMALARMKATDGWDYFIAEVTERMDIRKARALDWKPGTAAPGVLEDNVSRHDELRSLAEWIEDTISEGQAEAVKLKEAATQKGPQE